MYIYHMNKLDLVESIIRKHDSAVSHHIKLTFKFHLGRTSGVFWAVTKYVF